jgi:hypothetical protein
MFAAKDIVVWINRNTKEVLVRTLEWGVPEDHFSDNRRGWCDPIGAAYAQWQKMHDALRVQLMLETAIDLAMNGFALKQVLTAFAEVREFRALGAQSCPMCRALTKALVDRSLDAVTMSFEELLVHYAKRNEESAA